MPTHIPLQQYQEHRKAAIYQPSIFRYNCRGRFFASSDDPGSNGICHGIQSQLQHVRDLHPTVSKEECLQTFLRRYYRNPTAPYNSIEDVLEVPAILYPIVTQPEPESRTATATPTATATANNSNTDASNHDDGLWHDWVSYGSTNVNLLVLRNTVDGTEETLAIAPVNEFGFEIRDVGQDGEMISAVGVGRYQVLTENQYEWESSTGSKHIIQPTNQDGKSLPKETNQQQVFKPPTLRRKDEERDSQDDKDPNRNTSISAMTFIRFGQNAHAFSGKIVSSMKQNAETVRDAVREDFPKRCLQSGGRIINQFGKTAELTTGMMQKLYRIWKDGDDDDDAGGD